MKKIDGITLIALVITIIVLMILAGVSISVLLGDNGIIDLTKESANSWNEAGEIEANNLNELANDTSNSISGIGRNKGKNFKTLAELVEKGIIKIGDYVAYEPTTASWDWSTVVDGETYQTYSGSTSNTGTLTTQTTLNWRVLDKVGDQVILISDVPTTSTVYLSGANGYNNAVKLLDDLCSTLYSKPGVGTARSLKIEDIEDKLTYDYTSYVGTYQYGTTKAYTSASYRYYANIFANEKRGWVDGNSEGTLDLSEQNSFVTGRTQAGTLGITVTQTYWCKSMATTDFTEDIYYKLFINNGSNYNGYWLSSRCVWPDDEGTGYAVRCVTFGDVRSSSHTIFYSSGSMDWWDYQVRPVVTLNSDVYIDTTVSGKDGSTAAKAWVIY